MRGAIDTAMWLFVAIVSTINLGFAVRREKRYDALERQVMALEEQVGLLSR